MPNFNPFLTSIQRNLTFIILLASIMGILILINGYFYDGTLNQYQCYGQAFLFGTDRLQPQSQERCISLMQKNDATTRFSLPKEYPILSILAFTFPLFFNDQYYNLLFAIEISFILGWLCWKIKKERDIKSVCLLLTYLILGNIFILGSRFDLIPAFLTILCLISSDKKQFGCAYVFLALSVMFKFYTLPLVGPLILIEHLDFKKTSVNKKNHGPMIFLATISFALFISFLINPNQWQDPFVFFLNRPIEMESIPASINALYASLTDNNLCTGWGFGGFNLLGLTTNNCQNIMQPISSGLFFLSLTVFGYLIILKNLWIKRINLGQSFIAILLLLIATGKVFSPQYLIWLSPLIVYVYRFNKFWILTWGSICVLTTLIYPVLFRAILVGQRVDLYPTLWTILVFRNALIVILAIVGLLPSLKKNNFK
jgi:hypothetical protein